MAWTIRVYGCLVTHYYSAGSYSVDYLRFRAYA